MIQVHIRQYDVRKTCSLTCTSRTQAIKRCYTAQQLKLHAFQGGYVMVLPVPAVENSLRTRRPKRYLLTEYVVRNRTRIAPRNTAFISWAAPMQSGITSIQCTGTPLPPHHALLLCSIRHLHRCRPCALRSSTIINAAAAAARRAAVTAIECLWESRSVWAKTGGIAAAAVTQSWHVIHGIT